MVSNGYGTNSVNVIHAQAVSYARGNNMQKCPYQKKYGEIYVCSCPYDLNVYDQEVSKDCICSHHPYFEKWLEEMGAIIENN